MAEKQKKVETSEPVVNNRSERPAGILHSMIVVLSALLVVAAVTFGVFYFAVKNNINGLANLLLPQIIDHPILSIALPPELIPGDPEDAGNLTQKELIKKYDEYRTQVKALERKLDDAGKTIEQMKNEAQLNKDAEASLAENEAVLDSIRQEQAKLEEEKKAFSELIARGDTQSFKDYFEKVDKATAEAIYKELVTNDLMLEEKMALAKSFSEMEPVNAARVLTELFAKDQETLLDIFEGLKTSSAALILEQMDAKTAAEITKLLSDRKDR